MITDDQLAEGEAEAERQLQPQYDAQPPPDEETTERMRALMAAVALRKARDRARARLADQLSRGDSDTTGGYVQDRPDVVSEDVGGTCRKTRAQPEAGSQ